MKLLPSLDGFSLSASLYNLVCEILYEIAPDDREKHPKFSNPDQRVSLLKGLKLWNELRSRYQGSDLGIQMARRLTPQKAGVTGHLFLETENLRESVNVMLRYLPILADNIEYEYEERGDDALFTLSLRPQSLAHYSMLEFFMFTCYFWVLQYRGDELLPIKQASFTYEEPPHAAFYHAVAPQAALRFKQKRNIIRMDRAFFYEKNKKHSPYLQELITGHAEKLYASYRNENTVTQQVIQNIQRQLPSTPQLTIDSVAEGMNISVRTLNRYLQAEGTRFRDLLEQARKEIAGSMIGDPNLLVEDIAYLLGYNEYSSFSRAFRRWYGKSPVKYRGVAG